MSDEQFTVMNTDPAPPRDVVDPDTPAAPTEGDQTAPAAPDQPAPADAPDAAADQPPDTDAIGTVRPGDRDGLAALVVRSIGMGDSGLYDGAAVDEVKRRQEDAGLEADGVVAGDTWGLILRTPKLGQTGHEVLILRRLHNLDNGSTVMDQELVDAVGADSAQAFSVKW